MLEDKVLVGKSPTESGFIPEPFIPCDVTPLPENFRNDSVNG
jgi:hypothetical protein